jgi:hypothetical protein
MMSSLSCATPIRAPLRLSLHIEILITGNIRLFLRNLESLDDCFACFESIVSSLRFCGPFAYSNNEHAKQLLYALDDSIWGMKITTLEESADFGTLDTENCLAS